MISFNNFHDRTIAHFVPSPPPYREPDFVSSSGSAYWDIGDSVIRSSDHWAGQNGCSGQASCIWSLGLHVDPGEWASGVARYRDFVPRQNVDIYHPITKDDQIAAQIIQSAGGALPYPEWQSHSLQLPCWANKVFRGPSLLPVAALRLFKEDSAVQHVVCAQQARLDQILSGTDRIIIGKRMSMPEDHGLPCDL